MLGYAAALIAISMIDLGLTVYGISTGIAEEVNPILVWVLHEWGIPGLVIYKVAFTAIVVLCLEMIRLRFPRISVRRIYVAAIAIFLLILVPMHSAVYIGYFQYRYLFF